MPSYFRVYAVAVLLLSLAGLTSCSPAQDAPTRPGYMIVLTQDVDRAGMKDYARAAVPLLLEYEGLLLFATPEGDNEILEGGPFIPSVRVFQFPSVEAARGYYTSDAYQAAIPLRAGNGKVTVLISDAFVPDPKWTRTAG